MKVVRSLCSVGILIGLSLVINVYAQNGKSLFGDVKIDDSKAGDAAPPKVTVVLYKDAGGEIGRQNVANGSRYRFSNLQSVTGEYELAVEVDNIEIARMRVTISGLSNSPYGFQQDLEFAWKPKLIGNTRAGVVSTGDIYARSSTNASLLGKAQEAADKKKYDQAIGFLKQVVESDKSDFPAWTLLGTVYLIQGNSSSAEEAYQKAIEAKPNFALALLDLGKMRLSQKRFDDAVTLLTRAVEAQPKSADANYLLGESYLQLRKGSKAIPYLNEASNLGRPDAHLRLAWLYDAAGLKPKAAVEYEEFLKKKPDYPDRKKLEDYIRVNVKIAN